MRRERSYSLSRFDVPDVDDVGKSDCGCWNCVFDGGKVNPPREGRVVVHVMLYVLCLLHGVVSLGSIL